MKYISLLRGINMMGKKTILMADLRSLYEQLGFTEVISYIQSGNVLFNVEGELDNKQVVSKIEQAISDKYAFEVPVLLRTVEEMKILLTTNPFLKEENIDTKKLHLTFLAELPNPAQLDLLKTVDYSPDRFNIIGREVFLHIERYGRTKLSNNFFERKLKVCTTTRNWRTVQKLVNMVS